MFSDKMDICMLEILKDKAIKEEKYAFADYVKSWGNLSNKSNNSCYEQARCEISASSFLKNINIGQNSNLFIKDTISICDYYLSLLKK